MKYLYGKASLLLIACLFFASAAMAQFTISGNITDNGGEPLIGVSILVKGTTTGTVTDFNGDYTLDVRSGSSATLLISYTGFKTIERDVTSSTGTLNITMEDDIANLDEVVVTGLASGVKRSNSGNAITSIEGDALSDQTNPQTLDNALYGKIPGVQMTANGGAPGGGINVQLRGVSTLGAGSSQPLYIIDGVYMDNSAARTFRSSVSGAGGGSSSNNQDNVSSRISDINPDEIEKIEILKGPSAAAIYGTRANAGVIIITTKKGAAGQSKVSFSQDIGFARGQNFIGFDDWDEQKIRNYFGSNAEPQLELLREAQAADRIIDWEDFFYGETPLLSNTSVSASGGNQNTQFYASGNFQTEDGIIKNTGYDRYSFRVNIDHKFSELLSVKFNNNFIRTENQRGFTGNQNNTGGSIGYAIAYLPSYINQFPDESGVYPNHPFFGGNPVEVRDVGVNDFIVNRFISAAAIDLNLITKPSYFFKVKINGGADFVSSNSQVYFPETMQYQRTLANPGDVVWGNSNNLNTNLQAFAIFNADVGAINTNTSIGVVRLDQDVEFLANRGQGLAAGQNNLNWAAVQTVRAQSVQSITDVGIVAQEDINWQDRIIASVGIRFDKSTLNADQDKFYAFPKASLAVNLHNFDFFNSSLFSQVKVRAAYGETGGLPRFGQTFEPLNSVQIDGSLGGFIGNQGVDATLEPETASELELGVDLGFLDNRITLEATYYNKEVRDLILPLNTASSTGIGSIQTNAADLTNKGVELGLGVNAVRNDNFNWYTKLLFWNNVSEITRLAVPEFNTGGFGTALGSYAIAEGFSPTTVIGNPDNPDGPVGKTAYGDRQPDFQYSIISQMNFLKNFDFSFVLQGQQGGEAINLSAFLWDDGGTTPDWDGDDDGDGVFNGQERPGEAFGGNQNAGVWIEETTYLKLREVGLYYTFPQEVVSGIGFLDRLKLGISANNILLSTTYGSYDPEVSNFGAQPIAGGVEVTPYPSSRRFFFHLKADF
jgi:TonB-linked SusC/RagA family outer membrane protein